MSITGDLNTLESLNKEIERLSKHLRDLRGQKKDVEARISEFIETNDKPGIKYKGKQFLPQTTQVTDRSRSKKIRESDAADVLKKYGMSEKDSNIVIGEIVTAMRGPKTEKTRLIIKKEKTK